MQQCLHLYLESIFEIVQPLPQRWVGAKRQLIVEWDAVFVCDSTTYYVAEMKHHLTTVILAGSSLRIGNSFVK